MYIKIISEILNTFLSYHKIIKDLYLEITLKKGNTNIIIMYIIKNYLYTTF